jgi:hypothetical protein
LEAVNKIIKLISKTGSISQQREGRCGRKRETVLKDGVSLLRQSKIDPRKTTFDLQKDLAAAGVQVNDSTVRCRLLQVGEISCSHGDRPDDGGSKHF